MNTHADRTQEHKRQAVSNEVSQKQSGGKSSTFQFVDNRPEAISQRKLQEMANNSPRVKQLRVFQEKIDGGFSPVIQRVIGEEYLLQLATYFGVKGTVASVAVALGVSAGTLLAGLAVFTAVGAIYSVSKMVEYFSSKDPVETTVLDEDKVGLKKDIDSAMQKIKDKIIKEAKKSSEISKSLKGSGRDWMIYAPWSSWLNGMFDLLSSWSNSWKIEDTAGLLLDIGGALRKVTSEVDTGKEIMNDYMAESRTKNKKINKKSKWNKNLPKNTRVQAGVSATTGNLLSLLRYLDVNTVLEIEGLMNGVILYWKNSKVKKALGQFHTAAEVWTAYTFHLEKYGKNEESTEEKKND